MKVWADNSPMDFYNIVATDVERIKGQVISIIGGGGKTSLAHRIGEELATKGLKVIITTTTKISSLAGVPLVLVQGNLGVEDELKSLLRESNLVMVADSLYSDDKLQGIDNNLVRALLHFADVVLVESDGSRQRSLKTHKEHEPVIPPKSATVIIICGADVVGMPLDDSRVHRASMFAQKWGLKEGTHLSAEIIANELLSPRSYLKNIPLQAQISIYINKSDINRDGGKRLADQLSSSPHPVFLGSLKTHNLEKMN
jgi:probable selenium-dependent hydroxylase accessory protein YqeC